MIVRNGSSALTEVHFDGKSEKQVFVGNHLVWPTIDWNKYSFRVIATPSTNVFDYTASRNVDGITSMVVATTTIVDYIEIKPSTKISVADMKYINYKAKGDPLEIYYDGNHIPANMFDESVDDTSYNNIDNSILHIFKDLDYIGDNAFKSDGEGIINITFYKTVTKVPSLSSSALPNNFLTGRGYIYVPQSLEEAFKNADVWKNYADRINGY